MKIWQIAATAAFMVLGNGHSALAELKNITIGTNPSGSTFYLIGSGFAKVFQEELGIRSTAQPFTGASVYLPSISVGDITLGLASTVESGVAYEGKGDFPQPMTGLRSIARVWNIPYAFITKAESGIITADDLRGKRVMGDMPASQAATMINQAMVKSGGLELDDVNFMTSGGLMDGINAVVEGRADAAPASTAMPVLTELQASVPGGLRIIGNGSEASDEFFAKEISGVTIGTALPSEKHPFIIGETEIVSYDTMLITNEAISEDDVYAITKSLYDNWGSLQNDIGTLRGIAQNELALVNPSVPYHPGAIKFYKEVGLWTDAHEENQPEN
ncbi:NMT1/THI5 like protein [Marinovum algicola]|uniref:TRAP transporter solute receptor, TAXI family n=1 Tax=Marinovum algicola TaxID=42444 RepID=A0A975WET8_9RHOB|nr:TAXI family TRAP transporter solute-binding subunit [Marinovum algicola]SEK09059.1 TRAP transporter solute receptor, TAXI family [Marinovum algicola]SLN71731.1 NMT1/THI5 like protein [Marinovum algicola]